MNHPTFLPITKLEEAEIALHNATGKYADVLDEATLDFKTELERIMASLEQTTQRQAS